MSEESTIVGSLTRKLNEMSHYLSGEGASLGVYGGSKSADNLYTNGLSEVARINTRSSTQSGPYYLPDGGKIQFFMHDKPSEFYGKEACLVRNETIRGTFVVRVPSGTPFNLIFRYKDLFEERRGAVQRQVEYKQGGPYLNEREVGINCGYFSPVEDEDPLILPSKNAPIHHGTPIYVQHKGCTGNFWIPFACDKAEIPAMMKRIREYLETGLDSEPFGLFGKGQDLGNGVQNGFVDDPSHPLYDVREYPKAGSQATRLLGENSGGYGRGFTSSLNLDEEDIGARARDVRTAIDKEIARRIGPFTGDGPESYSTPDGFIIIEDTDNARKVNPANTDLPPRHLDKKTNALYKTEMCRNWNEVGDCRYGRSCQFAHGQKELRVVARHGQWKTKTCMAWLHGGCTYGSRCCYAHEVIPDNAGKGQSSNEQEPRGSQGSSADSQPSSFCDLFGSCHINT